MMAERKVIQVEPAGETARLLKLVGEEPITIESDGVRYRIEREEQERATIENYDPARALASLRKGIGMFKDLDIDEFNRELREQRGQDSVGRPAQ
jgi:hypothetical protein